MIRRTIAVIAILSLVAACGPASGDAATRDSAVAKTRMRRLATALGTADSGATNAPLARWVLPASLREISGLALTPDGRLFTHGDERGEVWEVDYRRGASVKRFTLGPNGVKADFEGITVVGDVFYMIASRGQLYEFREGTNDAHVPYEVHDPKLEAACEFEGVAFDASIGVFLLACKTVKGAGPRDALVLYRWSLGKDPYPDPVPLVVPFARAIGDNPWPGLHPSDVTVDPVTGHYVIIAAREQAIVEITPLGEVIASRSLPGVHAHAEGVAITRDGVLLLSDEAGATASTIALFRWRRP